MLPDGEAPGSDEWSMVRENSEAARAAIASSLQGSIAKSLRLSLNLCACVAPCAVPCIPSCLVQPAFALVLTLHQTFNRSDQGGKCRHPN